MFLFLVGDEQLEILVMAFRMLHEGANTLRLYLSCAKIKVLKVGGLPDEALLVHCSCVWRIYISHYLAAQGRTTAGLVEESFGGFFLAWIFGIVDTCTRKQNLEFLDLKKNICPRPYSKVVRHSYSRLWDMDANSQLTDEFDHKEEQNLRLNNCHSGDNSRNKTESRTCSCMIKAANYSYMDTRVCSDPV